MGEAATTTVGPAWFEYGRALLVHALATARPADDGGDAEIDAALRRVEGATEALERSLDDEGPFAALVANAGLGLAEAQTLALLAAAEGDMYCQQLVADFQGDPNRNRISLGSLSVILGRDHPGPLTVTHDAALRRTAFVEVHAHGPWSDHVVALHPGVVWALLGDGSPDPDLPPDVAVYDVDGGPGAGESVADLVVVTGTDRMRRRQVGVGHAFGDRFITTRRAKPSPDSQPAADHRDTDRQWAALVREATITGRGLFVEIDDELEPALQRWMRRASHLVWVLSSRGGPPIEQLPERPWLEVTAPASEPSDDEWATMFGTETARTHHLSYDQMHRVARVRDALGGDIDAAVRRLASGPLEQLTRRITPTRTWDDIILSAERLTLLQSVVDRYQHSNRIYDDWGFTPSPSRGLVALFSGPSGTGKTLASEIIAGALGLDVFKLDLSSVVSKYIGETEKNLEQIFDAASAGNMVLFFDEADSLFGKRSEVKDARDRYANIEVSYLLQRLEAYDGLVILATNFEKNVDEAFLRRIHVRVEFALPGPEERAAIWRHNFPHDAPIADDVDVEWLAGQFELSGAAIRNAAIHAAFAAATADTEIDMQCAVLGVAREYRKLGRLLKPKDFGDHFVLVAD